jgi:hypothetical protein
MKLTSLHGTRRKEELSLSKVCIVGLSMLACRCKIVVLQAHDQMGQGLAGNSFGVLRFHLRLKHSQVNMARRGMAATRTCPICGLEDEDSFHVFMRCPHALHLWRAMEEVWPMPRDELLKNT